MSVHGTPVSINGLIQACLVAGARLANPGEFSQRAFLNGKLDLAQAEAVRDIVDSDTELQFKLALRQQGGILGQAIEPSVSKLLLIQAHIDAHVDFSEELGPFDRSGAAKDLEATSHVIKGLLEQSQTSQRIRRGIRVALLGKPNAGKSSLFNRLVGENRAIVSDVPGTTRDFIEATVDLEGVPCTWIDTAGIRETFDLVESEGVRRAYQVAEEADLRLYLDDSERAIEPFLRVGSKSDLHSGSVGIRVSAVTGEGIRDLQQQVLAALALTKASEVAAPSNPRQISLLESAFSHLGQALAQIVEELPLDLPYTHIGAAINDLNEITGKSLQADAVTNIFSNFCLGK